MDMRMGMRMGMLMGTRMKAQMGMRMYRDICKAPESRTAKSHRFMSHVPSAGSSVRYQKKEHSPISKQAKQTKRQSL